MALAVLSCLKLLLLASLAYRIWLGWRLKSGAGDEYGQEAVPVPTPLVCVQLPLYNEPGQVEGLLASVCRLGWPCERLVIQVLDDSDDANCRHEIDRAVTSWLERMPQLEILVVRRTHRHGYKAGALNEGLALVPRAEYIALFDADFRPESDFLIRMMKEFHREEGLCAVQAAWSFRDSRHSLLTRLQETLLNLHFHLEHAGRQARGFVLNFNGTAGIWRRSALDRLGGWSTDSVTEDLLLSYRAGLMGMRVRYVGQVSCVSELPRTPAGFLVQQRRWARGHGQVLRLMRRDVIDSHALSAAQKIDALIHLGSYLQTTVLSCGLVAVPLWLWERHARYVRGEPWNTASVLPAVLWIVLLGCFFWLYAIEPRRFASASQDSDGSIATKARCFVERSVAPALVLASAPYFAVLILGSYLKGLMSQNALGTVFHRTPKSGQARSAGFMGVRDGLLVAGTSFYLMVLSVCAWSVEAPVAATALVFQGAGVPTWLVLAFVRSRTGGAQKVAPAAVPSRPEIRYDEGAGGQDAAGYSAR